MAQGYHHAILPLASPRDRRTEIRWALRDVELRTGHRPAGLWLPEAAVDQLTLRICAEEGVRWTILAPWQASDGTDVRHPQRIELGDGLRIGGRVLRRRAVDATVSFDSAATSDADRFVETHVAGPASRTAACPSSAPMASCTAITSRSGTCSWSGCLTTAAADHGHPRHHARRVAGHARRRATAARRASRSAPAGPAITASRDGRASAAAPPTDAGRRRCGRRSTGSRAPSTSVTHEPPVADRHRRVGRP